MIMPELPGYLTKMGAGHLLGYIIGLFTLGAFFSRFFSGRIADRAGRKVVMIFGTVVAALAGFAYVLVGYAHEGLVGDPETAMCGVWLFLGLRVLHGLSTGFRPTGTSAFLTDIMPIERRGEALGYLGVAGNAGMAGGPALGSYLAVEYGYDAMFLTSSALGIIALLFTLKLPESLPNARKVIWDDLNIFKGGVIEKAAWPAAVFLLPIAVAFGVFLTITPDFVEGLGYKYKGMFNTIIVAASISMRFIAGKASDKYGREPLLILGGFLLLIGMGIMSISTTKLMAALGGIVYGLSIGVNMPTIFAWTADLSPKGRVALGLGTMLMALEIGIGSGAFISGTLFAADKSYLPSIYLFCAVFGGVSSCILWIVTAKNKKRDKSPIGVE
jgi:MFS family permease